MKLNAEGNHSWLSGVNITVRQCEMKSAIKILESTIVGIDYGSKFAGTTVICYNSTHKVRFLESSRNADADAFLMSELDFLDPDLILIDAPLTLPGVYSLGNGYEDYFFRKCDRDLGAMSPMFLGGLTARAMKLKDFMNGKGKIIHETYPRKLVDLLELPKPIYKTGKKEIVPFLNVLVETLGVRINSQQITSWHHLDALLAFLSGLRYKQNQYKRYGCKEEGWVIV